MARSRDPWGEGDRRRADRPVDLPMPPQRMIKGETSSSE